MYLAPSHFCFAIFVPELKRVILYPLDDESFAIREVNNCKRP